MLKKLAYFTETMRRTYCMAEQKESGNGKDLTRFLKNISISDLKEIADGPDGAILLTMKKNPRWVTYFTSNIDTTLEFRDWVSNFSRSWNLLN